MGSDGDKAAVSTAQRAYTASGYASGPKATTPAMRGTRTARGGMRTAEAYTGTSDEGADGNKVAASTARRAYAASGANDDPKARSVLQEQQDNQSQAVL